MHLNHKRPYVHTLWLNWEIVPPPPKRGLETHPGPERHPGSQQSRMMGRREIMETGDGVKMLAAKNTKWGEARINEENHFYILFLHILFSPTKCLYFFFPYKMSKLLCLSRFMFFSMTILFLWHVSELPHLWHDSCMWSSALFYESTFQNCLFSFLYQRLKEPWNLIYVISTFQMELEFYNLNDALKELSIENMSSCFKVIEEAVVDSDGRFVKMVKYNLPIKEVSKI